MILKINIFFLLIYNFSIDNNIEQEKIFINHFISNLLIKNQISNSEGEYYFGEDFSDFEYNLRNSDFDYNQSSSFLKRLREDIIDSLKIRDELKELDSFRIDNYDRFNKVYSISLNNNIINIQLSNDENQSFQLNTSYEKLVINNITCQKGISIFKSYFSDFNDSGIIKYGLLFIEDKPNLVRYRYNQDNIKTIVYDLDYIKLGEFNTSVIVDLQNYDQKKLEEILKKNISENRFLINFLKRVEIK